MVVIYSLTSVEEFSLRVTDFSLCVREQQNTAGRLRGSPGGSEMKCSYRRLGKVKETIRTGTCGSFVYRYKNGGNGWFWACTYLVLES